MLMKLVVAIVAADYAAHVLDALIAAHYGVTKSSSTSGFRRKGNTTFLIGVRAEEGDGVLKCLEGVCREKRGGKDHEQTCASVFALDVEKQIRM